MLVCVGGTATVDGGAGLLSALPAWPGACRCASPATSATRCSAQRGAARVFGPQKGAGPEAVEELERRLAAIDELAPYRDLPGAGAGGGLGAALASLGGELVEGAELVLDLIGFDERARGAALAVTGEGTVDETTLEGKAPGAVAAPCRRLGVRCVALRRAGRGARRVGRARAQRRPGPGARRPRRPRRGARASSSA